MSKSDAIYLLDECKRGLEIMLGVGTHGVDSTFYATLDNNMDLELSEEMHQLRNLLDALSRERRNGGELYGNLLNFGGYKIEEFPIKDRLISAYSEIWKKTKKKITGGKLAYFFIGDIREFFWMKEAYMGAMPNKRVRRGFFCLVMAILLFLLFETAATFIFLFDRPISAITISIGALLIFGGFAIYKILIGEM